MILHRSGACRLHRETPSKTLKTGTCRLAVNSFFDPDSFTITHVAYDPETKHAVIIDSVMGFAMASGTLDTSGADSVIRHVHQHGLVVDWILETHVHADHLSAAKYLQGEIGGLIGIGNRITEVQHHFGAVFNADGGFPRDGSEFDRLFEDGERFDVGDIPVEVLHVPGHTPADVAYLIGDTVFPGDTLFMPDCGTARADFPGGDALTLFRSIKRLLSLSGETRMFLCHDYGAPSRDVFAWETTVEEQRRANIHVRDGISEKEFIALRHARDAGLGVPQMIFPSVQVNMRAGELPPAEQNGVRYLKLPLSRA